MVSLVNWFNPILSIPADIDTLNSFFSFSRAAAQHRQVSSGFHAPTTVHRPETTSGFLGRRVDGGREAEDSHGGAYGRGGGVAADREAIVLLVSCGEPACLAAEIGEELLRWGSI